MNWSTLSSYCFHSLRVQPRLFALHSEIWL